MSDTVTVDQYTGLIPSENQGQPNFTATIALICQAFVDNQNVINSLPALFDVNTAVGVQLDAVGLWVGVSRYVAIPSGVFFTWGVLGLAWSQAVWHEPGTPTDSVAVLGDSDYRVLIKARIIANSWNGTIAGAYPALNELFNGSATPNTVITLVDNLNMTMTITISGQSPGPILTAIIENGELGLKPVGVAIIVDDQTTSLVDDGGVLVLLNETGWQIGPTGLSPGALFATSAAPSTIGIVPGFTPVLGPPVYLDSVSATQLLVIGGIPLPTSNPGVGTRQVWNNGGELAVS